MNRSKKVSETAASSAQPIEMRIFDRSTESSVDWMNQMPHRATAEEIQIRVPATSSTTSRAIAGTSRTLMPWTGVTIETSPILTPKNVKASPARNRAPTVNGCQNSDTGCMLPPISVSAEKPIAVTQVTTISVVHVEASRAWARLSSSRAKTVRMLDAKGSNR